MHNSPSWHATVNMCVCLRAALQERCALDSAPAVGGGLFFTAFLHVDNLLTFFLQADCSFNQAKMFLLCCSSVNRERRLS